MGVERSAREYLHDLDLPLSRQLRYVPRVTLLIQGRKMASEIEDHVILLFCI